MEAITWQMIFDGKNVSLRPSIGSWSLPCQSHYLITNSKVAWYQSGRRSRSKRGGKRKHGGKENTFRLCSPLYLHHKPQALRQAEGRNLKTKQRRVSQLWHDFTKTVRKLLKNSGRACKPDSVDSDCSKPDDHSSRSRIASELQQPTRGLLSLAATSV